MDMLGAIRSSSSITQLEYLGVLPGGLLDYHLLLLRELDPNLLFGVRHGTSGEWTLQHFHNDAVTGPALDLGCACQDSVAA
jgi:hypothetical protein